MLDSLIFSAHAQKSIIQISFLLFADVAHRKRQMIPQRWRKSSGHRGLEPANPAAGMELGGRGQRSGGWGGLSEVANLNLPSSQSAVLDRQSRQRTSQAPPT